MISLAWTEPCEILRIIIIGDNILERLEPATANQNQPLDGMWGDRNDDEAGGDKRWLNAGEKPEQEIVDSPLVSSLPDSASCCCLLH